MTKRTILAFASLLASSILVASAGEDSWSWRKGDQSLSLMKGEQVIWGFGLDSIYRRAHFHPLSWPGGAAFTDTHAVDHPWHLGLWFCFKSINHVEFWESGFKDWKTKELRLPEERPDMGLISVTGHKITPKDDFSAKIEVDISYAMPKMHGGQNLMLEKRILQVSAPDADGSYQIDTTLNFEVLEPVTLDKYFYGGFHLRFPAAVKRLHSGDTPGKTMVFTKYSELSGNDPSSTPSKFLMTDLRQTDAKCVVYILDHEKNISYPTVWVKAYSIGAVLTGKGDIQLEKGRTFTLKYRVMIRPAPYTQPPIEECCRQFSEG